MPDITLCRNKDCPLKDICYRYRAVPDPVWQSYFDPQPPESENCEHFMSLMVGDELQPVEANDG